MKNFLMALIMLLGTFGFFGLPLAKAEKLEARMFGVPDISVKVKVEGNSRFDLSGEGLPSDTAYNLVYTNIAGASRTLAMVTTSISGTLDITYVKFEPQMGQDKVKFLGLFNAEPAFEDGGKLELLTKPDPDNLDLGGAVVAEGTFQDKNAGNNAADPGDGNNNNDDGPDVQDCDDLEPGETAPIDAPGFKWVTSIRYCIDSQ